MNAIFPNNDTRPIAILKINAFHLKKSKSDTEYSGPVCP